MTNNAQQPTEILDEIHVLDGGLASELEHLGAKIDGPLWSAHVLEDAPEKVLAVQRAYIEAGAQCLLTASYQISRRGYVEVGLTPERADAALLRSVELAKSAAAEFPDREVLIAASLGPYGAALHDGSEYHGNYDCAPADLVAFHSERIRVLAAAGATQSPDLLAFETLPSLAEARAIGEALRPYPSLKSWFTFTCIDGQTLVHGEKIRDCAAAIARFQQTVAIGVNCTHPALIPSLIAELRAASNKPVVVYPNSGEGWDAGARCWTGRSDPADFGAMAAEWVAAGRSEEH